MTPARTMSSGLRSPYAVFTSTTGDVYVDNGYVNHRVEKWSWNATTGIAVMNVTSFCADLFIDQQQTLYCSNNLEHKVVKMSLSSGSDTVTLAAGNGTSGSGAYQLHNPNGIFVDDKLNLYVTDCRNDRIQLFLHNQLNATTIAGSGASGTISLSCPVAVILDADGYLFISDYIHNRIVRSGPFGYHCLLGCSGVAGAASNQLSVPRALRFDSYGNLFVVDLSNNRIQKFLLSSNSCGTYLRSYL